MRVEYCHVIGVDGTLSVNCSRVQLKNLQLCPHEHWPQHPDYGAGRRSWPASSHTVSP
jgi:hypothetical protein